MIPTTRRPPEFGEFRKMLRREPTARPVLYEHYIEWPILLDVLGRDAGPQDDPPWGWCVNLARAFARLGHDCAPLYFSHLVNFQFVTNERATGHSVSQNEGAVLPDAAALAGYRWPDPEAVEFNRYLDAIAEGVPAGMKLLLYPPRGVFENLVDLVGFDNLCLAFFDQPEFVEQVCREVGSRIARYLERGVGHEIIGGIFVSDDLGFKTGTMASPELLRRFVLPWHKRFVEIAHRAGKIAILHSCGHVAAVMDDIIDDLRYDAKHSYEDVICPVEEMYARYGRRIAILGGLDNDFLTRATPAEVERRARALAGQPGYALGAGNSLTAAMPRANIAALLRAAGVR
jgi:uroporphyrinogen decarboxylase